MNLKFSVLEGKDLRNVQGIGKQDPYALVKCGKEKFQTKTCEDAGAVCSIYFLYYFN